MGYVDIIAPISSDREAQWRVIDKIGIDPEKQQVIKALKSVETVSEIAA